MKLVLSIALMVAVITVAGQGMQDSVFALQQVEIRSWKDFTKETAGMKADRIDSVLLATQVHLDLSSILADNSTIHVKDYGRGALSTAAFRGTSPSHTQVSWNGLVTNSPMLGMVDLSLVPAFIIDAMTIEYGAGSVASRGGGLGGLISIENQPDWNEKFGGRLLLDFGSFHTSNLFGQISLGKGEFRSVTRIYRTNSLNDYLFENRNIIERDSVSGKFYYPVQQNKNAAFGKNGFTQEFYLRRKGKILLSNKSWLQSAYRSIPMVLSNEYSGDKVQNDNLQEDATVKNVTEINYYGASTRIALRSGIDRQVLDYEVLTHVNGKDPVQTVGSHSRMTGWQNSLELRHDLSQKLSARLQGSVNSYKVSTLDSVLHTGYDTTRTESSVFAGVFYAPASRFQVALQLRKDFVKGYAVPLIYSAGMNYSPFTGEALVVKASFSRNFHQPALNDLYWQPGGNPDLLPEEGHTAELSAISRMKFNELKVGTSLTAYHSSIRNWIMWLPGFKGYWEPFNISMVRSAGIEYSLSLEYSLGKTSLFLKGNLTAGNTLSYGSDNSGMNLAEGEQLPYIPKISGNIFITIEHDGYYLQYRNNSTGKRFLLNAGSGAEGNDENSLSAREPNHMYTLYPHYLNRAVAGKQFTISPGIVTVELYVDNLFNESYRNILNRFMPGRSFNIHLKYNF